jgi:hypothetical protein
MPGNSFALDGIRQEAFAVERFAQAGMLFIVFRRLASRILV